MKKSNHMKNTLLKLGLAATALLGAGCNEYKYFDIHVAFDPAMYDSRDTGLVTLCQVTVSGAASGKFTLPPGLCPNRVGGAATDAGTFEFSTFADSGTVTFQVDTYTGAGLQPDCITGTGMTPVAVAGPSTIKAEVVIKKTGKAACTNTTQPMDASIDL
jgi:hypothetical protein